MGAGGGMKFLADMGISPQAVPFLEGLGHEALHLHAQNLERMEDSAIETQSSVPPEPLRCG